MKPIKILALILATIVFFSCSKEETITKEEPIKTLEETTKLFKYNSNGYIKSITTYNSNNIETSHIEYEYNTEKQIIKSIDYKTGKRTKEQDNYFTYDVNGYVKTHKRKFLSKGKWIESTNDFNYEINGSIINVKEINEGEKRYTYEYNNDNLSYFVDHIDEVVSEWYAPRFDVITNDNQKNPYFEGFPLKFSLAWLYGKNNILKKRNSGSKNVKYNNTVTYQYDYNSDGLPTKKTYYDFYGERGSDKNLEPIKHIVHYKYEK